MSNHRINDQQLATAFKALANPHRLDIFRRLMSCCVVGESCELESCQSLFVGELGKDLDIAPSTISHHLKELNHAGLIAMQRRGKHVECWIKPQMIEAIRIFLTIS